MFRWPVEISAKIQREDLQPRGEIKPSTRQPISQYVVSQDLWVLQDGLLLNYTYKMDLHFFEKPYIHGLYLYPVTNVISPPISGVFKWAGPCCGGIFASHFSRLCASNQSEASSGSMSSSSSVSSSHAVVHEQAEMGCLTFVKEAMDENMLNPKVWKKTQQLNRFCNKKSSEWNNCTWA